MRITRRGARGGDVTSAVSGDRPPLPDTVIALTDSLQRGIAGILGRGFAGLFLYGALAFPRPERWLVDVDFHVLVQWPLTDAERGDLRALYATLAHASELGRELDGYYVLLSEAARGEPPRHQLDLTMRDEAWALHRAHVRAGRYFLLAGIDPREIVPQPTWAELEAGLRAEMRFVEDHHPAWANEPCQQAGMPVPLHRFVAHEIRIGREHDRAAAVRLFDHHRVFAARVDDAPR